MPSLICQATVRNSSIRQFVSAVQIIKALERASKVDKPPVSAMFTDVYAEMPWHLEEQLQETLDIVQRHPHLLPPGMPIR